MRYQPGPVICQCCGLPTVSERLHRGMCAACWNSPVLDQMTEIDRKLRRTYLVVVVVVTLEVLLGIATMVAIVEMGR